MFDRFCLSPKYLLINYVILAVILFLIKKQIVSFFIYIGTFCVRSVKIIIKNYRFLLSFFFFIAFISIIEIYVESSLLFVPKAIFPHLEATSGIIAISIVMSLFLLFIMPNIFDEYNKSLRVQKINNQHSWVQYFHFSIVSAPIVSLIVFNLKVFPDFWHLDSSLFMLGGNSLLSIVIRFILMLIGLSWYWLIKPFNQKEQYNQWKFAPLSIDIENDRFNWKNAAEREANNLLLMDKYVSVVLIDGKQGDGKSSYARMIIEALISNKGNKILYTYISLTETNQEKDFTKMFLERCFASISDRYPKINFSNSLPMIREGLRDNGYSVWSLVVDAFTKINSGISKTLSIVHDPYSKSDEFVSKDIAEKFGNVEQINEDIWIILVDEIDRAPTGEVYRAIETIERYKHDGRCGLPVKIVFMLCVDRLTLFKNLGGKND